MKYLINCPTVAVGSRRKENIKFLSNSSYKIRLNVFDDFKYLNDKRKC